VTDAHLTVLDVGHGSAAVLTGPNGTVVIDSGPGPWLLRYLQDQGITHIDCVAITHSDEDHLKGLTALFDAGTFTFGVVRVNSDAQKTSRLWEAVAFSLDQLARRQELDFQLSLAEGDPLPEVADGVTVEVLAPSRYLASRGPGSTDHEGRRLSANSVSAALRVVVDGQPHVLLAADIDEVGLANLLDGRDLRAPVLIFPHHGGNVGSGASPERNVGLAAALCQAVQPTTVLFSTGRGRHGTPRPEIIAAVRGSGAGVRVACTQLSTRCAVDLPPDEAFAHLTALPARGRESLMCCAGTMRIPLIADLEPSAEAHQAFVAAHAPTALCQA
jgi:beta-lactamase superfamily II metal-dependent hydrolase